MITETHEVGALRLVAIFGEAMTCRMSSHLVMTKTVAPSCLLTLILVQDSSCILLRFQAAFFTLAHLKLACRIASGWVDIWIAVEYIAGRWLIYRHVVRCIYCTNMRLTCWCDACISRIQCLVLIACKLTSTISFRWSWPLHLASSLLRIYAFARLPHCPSLALDRIATHGPNGKVMVLRSADGTVDRVSLIQHKFTSFI